MILKKPLQWITLITSLYGAIACSPVNNTISHQYRIDHFSQTKYSKNPSAHTILVSATESITGYQTDAMLYIRQPYTIMPFAQNAWISPPADMVYPLIMESLEKSGYFRAVASGPYADQSDFRLDSELLALQQNFIHKPSHLEMTLKIVLTDVKNNRVVASKLFSETIPCPSDTPYGGVIAANQASLKITQQITNFAIAKIRHSSR